MRSHLSQKDEEELSAFFRAQETIVIGGPVEYLAEIINSTVGVNYIISQKSGVSQLQLTRRIGIVTDFSDKKFESAIIVYNPEKLPSIYLNGVIKEAGRIGRKVYMILIEEKSVLLNCSYDIIKRLTSSVLIELDSNTCR